MKVVVFLWLFRNFFMVNVMINELGFVFVV